MNGKCVRWNGRYGFIKGEDKNVYFAHISELKTGSMYQGDIVTFDASISKKGLDAKNVRRAEVWK